MNKKNYYSPEFEFVSIKLSDVILGSEPEGPIHENDPGEGIDD